MNEQQRSRTREIWRTALMIAVPTLLAVALIMALLWANTERARADAFASATRAVYSRAYAGVTEDLFELETALSKLLAVNSPAQYVLLLDEVWRLSGSAVSNMSMLPLSHVDTTGLNSFIVRLGDYAHTLTKKAVRGGVMTEEESGNILALRDSCARLAAEYADGFAAGEIPAEPAGSGEFFYTGTASEYQDQDSIAKFPTLIYDGPFSESSEKREPRGLSGGSISPDEAERIAEAVARCDLEFEGEGRGRIPTYEFSADDEEGGFADVSITVQGGALLHYMAGVTGNASGRPDAEGAKRYADAALARLTELGYSNMTATYAQYYGGAALINCAAVQDGVILYSDLIKVWVDREDMSVRGIDATNYIYSHTRRELPAPAVTRQEAETLLSPSLRVMEHSIALIPLTPGTEALCHEFKCTLGTDKYIVYINALTGDEQEIFRIIDSEDGEMVI